MDLGIKGRKAIVCASSRGLGKGCAMALAQAGVALVISRTASRNASVVGLDLSSGARAGLTAFLAGVARSVADRNVTINNLLPGYFDTDRMRSSFAVAAKRSGSPQETITAQRLAQIPARRFGTAAEFGQACAFLCSVHAAYMTGQSILMDGGLYQSTF
jgi:3-oxoacyl-[acyl-carrier protein] reductase